MIGFRGGLRPPPEPPLFFWGASPSQPPRPVRPSLGERAVSPPPRPPHPRVENLVKIRQNNKKDLPTSVNLIKQ